VAEAVGATIIQLGTSVLDLGRGMLSRDGQVIPLRAKSFRLLQELARQPGRVVPKDELLDAVWPDVIVTEASLSQAVRDIRKALADEEGQILRTVARRGFMLCPTGSPLPQRVGPASSIRPRIALLPLRDRTGLPDMGPVLDGFVEEMTVGLAHFRNLTVLAQHSAFAAAADKTLDLANIGAKLRADYIVDGSAHVTENRLLLSMALNKADTGEVLWGESFVGEGTSWLSLQDVIARRIVARLFASVEEASHRSSLREDLGALTAFQHLARGRSLFRTFEPGVNEQALEHFAAAIKADPSVGVAYSYHGLAEAALHGYQLSPPDVKRRIRAQGMRGAQLSPDEARCHGILSFFHLWLGEFEQAEQAAHRAVEVNPCDADGLFNRGFVLVNRGRPQESLAWFERAKDINPLWPGYYDNEHSFALFHLGRYDESARMLKRVPRRNARQEMRLAATYALMGERALARSHVSEARSLAPSQDFLDLARVGYSYEHDHDRQHLLDAIQLALDAAT
jgi:TolB-like protein/tetratricopeptide (TPR) repeat protein